VWPGGTSVEPAFELGQRGAECARRSDSSVNRSAYLPARDRARRRAGRRSRGALATFSLRPSPDREWRRGSSTRPTGRRHGRPISGAPGRPSALISRRGGGIERDRMTSCSPSTRDGVRHGPHRRPALPGRPRRPCRRGALKRARVLDVGCGLGDPRGSPRRSWAARASWASIRTRSPRGDRRERRAHGLAERILGHAMEAAVGRGAVRRDPGHLIASLLVTLARSSATRLRPGGTLLASGSSSTANPSSGRFATVGLAVTGRTTGGANGLLSRRPHRSDSVRECTEARFWLTSRTACGTSGITRHET